MISSRHELKSQRADIAIARIKNATEHLEDQDFHNRAILLSKRINENNRQQGLNTISHDEYAKEESKINHALLALIDDLPDDLFDHPGFAKPSPVVMPAIKQVSSLWKKLGYVVLILGLLAGIVRIVQCFQNPPAILPAAQTKAKPDSLATPPNISTSGDQSPVINAPGGDVHINYGDEAEKPANKKGKN